MNNKILIIEDEAIIAEDMMKTLQLIGCTNSVIALNDEEALDFINKFKFKMAFIDVKLKGSNFNGIELAKIIAHRSPVTKIIFVTAYSDKETLKSICETNHLSYVLKPFEVSKVKNLVETLCLNGGSHEN